MAASTLDDAIKVAYATALEASHGSACVAIHIGQGVFDQLRSRVTLPDGLPPVTTFFGFPLVVEEGARPEHISVRTIKVIS